MQPPDCFGLDGCPVDAAELVESLAHGVALLTPGSLDKPGRVRARRAPEPPLDLLGFEGIRQVVLVHEVRAHDVESITNLDLRAVVPREPLSGEPLHLPCLTPVVFGVTSPDVYREHRRLVLWSSWVTRSCVLDRAEREHAVEQS